jgi:hypothetical protein
LNSQTDIERVKIEQVTDKGNTYFVSIVEWVKGGNPNADGNVKPELTKVNGKWQFANFHYKDGKKDFDLLQTLKELRDERKKYK